MAVKKEQLNKGTRVRYCYQLFRGCPEEHEVEAFGVVKRVTEDGAFVIYDNRDCPRMETGDEPYTAALTRFVDLDLEEDCPKHGRKK